MCKKTIKDSYRSKFDVLYHGRDKYYGIQVEDHLYITNDGMITHNSGKSFIIYLLVRYYAKRTLIIVPTTSLVSQLASDFADYGFDSDAYVHRVFAGQDKGSTKPITITTWQSIYKLPSEFFSDFDVVIGDEAHLFKAKSLTSILAKIPNARYRFGFTGTLDGTQTHRLVLEGLFGPVRKVISTAELIEKKHLAEFNIKAIVLSYPDDIRKMIARSK
jgi:superfamily II DNA or RNA helicase